MNVTMSLPKHYAFIDFAEKDAVEKIVEKSHEEPFCIGEVMLKVEKKKTMNRGGMVRRTPYKKE